MAIDKLSLAHSQLSNPLLRSPVIGGQSRPTDIFRKTFGEPIPQIVDISKDPFLMALFGPFGAAEHVRKKLVALSRKNGRIIPARGTIASALAASEETGEEDSVFVGVDFLARHHKEVETVAGVLAHEWGHLVSEFPNGINPDELTWDEIFGMRRDEEGQADSYAGRMLYRMCYRPESFIRFLSQKEFRKETTKYHPVPVRVALVGESYRDEERKNRQAKNLFNGVYPHLQTVRLIAVA